ncbi:keratin [Striga asiatica]|uniref:Keratin n=1 Tax=Striga asiatica TaxID=4170 RepID=A0A5A7Q348_STRAF|nr:keratin [Striga asiatica]
MAGAATSMEERATAGAEERGDGESGDVQKQNNHFNGNCGSKSLKFSHITLNHHHLGNVKLEYCVKLWREGFLVYFGVSTRNYKPIVPGITNLIQRNLWSNLCSRKAAVSTT